MYDDYMKIAVMTGKQLHEALWKSNDEDYSDKILEEMLYRRECDC
jgi:hypothetical protein